MLSCNTESFTYGQEKKMNLEIYFNESDLCVLLNQCDVENHEENSMTNKFHDV